jgi:hypothetical protein
MTTYTYSIANDTANGAVFAHILQNEIADTSISVALDGVSTYGDNLNIVFKGSITTEEETILGQIVALHDGIEEDSISIVSILEEDPNPEKQTGGHFRAETIAFDVDAIVGDTVHTVSWPHPISMLSLEWVGTSDKKGDCFSIFLSENKIVGALTANVAENDTVINVSPTVVANCFIGMQIKLYDGTNEEKLGYLTGIDKANGTITVENGSTQAFSAATPTYVRIIVEACKNIEMEETTASIQVGASKIGGSFVPAGTIVSVHYKNHDGAAGKRFKGIVEYLY